MLEWQTYDNEFRSEEAGGNEPAGRENWNREKRPQRSRLDKPLRRGRPRSPRERPREGQRRSEKPSDKGYLTVYHNGIKIHDGVELSRNGG